MDHSFNLSKLYYAVTALQQKNSTGYIVCLHLSSIFLNIIPGLLHHRLPVRGMAGVAVGPRPGAPLLLPLCQGRRQRLPPCQRGLPPPSVPGGAEERRQVGAPEGDGGGGGAGRSGEHRGGDQHGRAHGQDAGEGRGHARGKSSVGEKPFFCAPSFSFFAIWKKI